MAAQARYLPRMAENSPTLYLDMLKLALFLLFVSYFIILPWTIATFRQHPWARMIGAVGILSVVGAVLFGAPLVGVFGWLFAMISSMLPTGRKRRSWTEIAREERGQN
ncbi:MAG: hypothetical protein ACPGOV_15400 [Magnetovibrionaceae bacterium]